MTHTEILIKAAALIEDAPEPGVARYTGDVSHMQEKSAKTRFAKEFLKLKGQPGRQRQFIHNLLGPDVRRAFPDSLYGGTRALEPKSPFHQKHKTTITRILQQRLGQRNLDHIEPDVSAFKRLLDDADLGQAWRRPISSTRLRDIPQWNASGVRPDDLVEIEHGGTLPFLKKFLGGKSKGYATDGFAHGIMVHPGPAAGTLGREGGRSEFYANRAFTRDLAPPGRLTASVPARFLKAAPNSYEATLIPAGVKHLKNVKLKSFIPEAVSPKGVKDYRLDRWLGHMQRKSQQQLNLPTNKGHGTT